MSTIVIFLYSKYVPQVKPYLEIINNLEYIQTLCVDNEKIRQVIMQSSLLNIKKVPCFIVINQNKEVFQYTDVATFLQKLIQANTPQEKRREKIEKSPIQNVVELEKLQETQQPEIREAHDDYIQTNKSYPTNSKPVSSQSRQDVEVKKSNKTSIGEIINYQKEKNEKLKPETQPHPERTSISKGQGHDEMGRSSLRDNSPKKAFDVIEDIEEESSQEGLINFSKNDGGSEKKEKRISDIKSLVSEMSDQREEQLKKLSKNN
jgi:hypothetical protein